MAQDVDAAYVQERDSLVQDLARLERPKWAVASLCEGWSVRDVVAHLLMPYDLGGAAFLGRMLSARFNFDRLALNWAKKDRRTPDELRHALAATTVGGFNVPGAGPLAPLSHLAIHAHDVRGPLRIDTALGTSPAQIVLDDITRGRHPVPADRLAGLHLQTTDAQWQFGDGMDVSGPAGAMLSALSGRPAALERLHGDGVDVLRSRLT